VGVLELLMFIGPLALFLSLDLTRPKKEEPADPEAAGQLPVLLTIHFLNLCIVGMAQDNLVGPIPTPDLQGLAGLPVIQEAQEVLEQQAM
jgi:hypothetical protein